MTGDHRVSFALPAAAKSFCRAVAPKGALRGAAFWSSDEWLRTASRWARQIGVQRSAEILASQKAKGVSITGVFCTRCGTTLSAPESVAAGVGPECQRALS